MILTKQQQAVLERLRLAHGTEPGLPVALSRGEACAASRLVERGLVRRSAERGKVLFVLTPEGERALGRQAQQLRMFAREPGIDDPREADAFRRVEEAARRALPLMRPEAGTGTRLDAELVHADLKLALDDLDAARARKPS